MNAFRRSHAIKGLEELSLTICTHMTLLVTFPQHEAARHWQGELGGFLKTLQRWNKGKTGGNNYSAALIAEVLTDFIDDMEHQELIEATLESKGLDPDISWSAVKELARGFASTFG